MLEPKIVVIPQDLLDEIKKYESILWAQNFMVAEDSAIYEAAIMKKIKETYLTETFQELLFKLIDKSNLSEVEIYQKAYIDRKLFSKIRSDKHYHPSFGTVTLFALALELSTLEFEKLLNSASYSLSTNTYSSITLRYCFDKKIYDISTVNNMIYTLTNKEIKEL